MSRPRTVDDEELLAGAARAIGEHGPARLTLAAVAADVGLAPATLVQRFGSKRGLLLAVAARGENSVRRTFEQATAAHASPIEALHAGLWAMASSANSPRAMANHLAFLHIDLTDPDFRAHVLAHGRAMRSELRRLLDAAVAAGELKPTDTRRLADAVQVAYNGTLITWAMDGRGSLRRRLREQAETALAPHRPSSARHTGV